jgi:Leucine-rich repeat (LRR) protein
MCIICTSREEELLQLETLDCSGCQTLKVIPIIPSLQRLDCSYCPLLINIPLLPSLKTLVCSKCPLLVNIPLFPSLQYLSCYNCPLLMKIPLILSLQTLSCYNCPLLTSIPFFPSLQRLDCSDCPLLVNIPVASYYTDNSGCRWLNDLTLVTQVIICQKYIKSSHRGRLLTRALKTKSFVEWIYSPEVGGKYIKRRLLQELKK